MTTLMEYDRRKEIRFSCEQEERWQRAAAEQGYTSLSEWMRDACDQKAAERKRKRKK